jgi:vacuolar iron transporter family protein
VKHRQKAWLPVPPKNGSSLARRSVQASIGFASLMRSCLRQPLNARISEYLEKAMDSKLTEPWVGFGRHYIRDIVYAAHDGVITTFAVVAGARGAGLGSLVVLALGLANLAADGLSMAVGNYLGIKSERAAELQDRYHEWAESVHAARHASVTWAAFALAGIVPLIPFVAGQHLSDAFRSSLVLSATALLAIGVLRARVTRQPWWRSGLEMLLVGGLAGAAAFLVGEAVQRLAKTGTVGIPAR